MVLVAPWLQLPQRFWWFWGLWWLWWLYRLCIVSGSDGSGGFDGFGGSGGSCDSGGSGGVTLAVLEVLVGYSGGSYGPGGSSVSGSSGSSGGSGSSGACSGDVGGCISDWLTSCKFFFKSSFQRIINHAGHVETCGNWKMHLRGEREPSLLPPSWKIKSLNSEEKSNSQGCSDEYYSLPLFKTCFAYKCRIIWLIKYLSRHRLIVI